MINTIVEIEHKQDFEEQGFYSNSYLAIDKRLNRLVAVKDIIYENLTSDSDFNKYFDEAYKLSLASHPRVLPVYYVGLDHNVSGTVIPRIVTCFFQNGSLNSYLQKTYALNKTLCLDEIIRFAHDIIQGMIHLHSIDLVHLDLKASNVYIGEDKKLVLGDFGQAKFIKDGVIFDHIDLYPALAPIEAHNKKVLDKTTDIYQFGLLLYSMLCFNSYRQAIEHTYKISTSQLKVIFRDKPENVDTLKAEFRVNMKKYISDIKNSLFPSRSFYPYYVPNKLKSIIEKCLQPSVTNRYNNFYEIQSDLNDFIFPKGVSNFYQVLEDNSVHFTKDDKPCVLSIQNNNGKYVVNALKNGRNVSDCNKSDISEAKLSNILFNLADKI
jgi:serine/threonine protein kinase